MSDEGTGIIRRSPIGPLIGIMPWNFPYYQVARFAGPNLCLGNTILLKPAGQCPESGLAIQSMFDDAGFPEGAYQTIFASNEQIADLIADPRVRGVSLTGSERAGAAVAEVAGRNLKKVVLELGGSDPFILLGTGNLGRSGRSGGRRPARQHRPVLQRRQALHRPRGSVRRLPRRLRRGDERSRAERSDLGATPRWARSPRPAATERLQEQLDRAVEQGATVVAGGERDGNFFPSTVLADVTPDNDAYGEEFFGPVAMVFKVGSEDEAIRLGNDTDFGLGSYVFTDDRSRRCGWPTASTPAWSTSTASAPTAAELPFGGVKRSGFGRELGRYGIEEFVNKKLIRVIE